MPNYKFAEITKNMNQAVHKVWTLLQEGGDVPEELYSVLFPIALTKGRTTVLCNVYPEEYLDSDEKMTTTNILHNYMRSTDNVPFRNDGLIIGVVMNTPTTDLLDMFKTKGSEKMRFKYITDLFIAHKETMKCNMYPKPGAQLTPSIAKAVHYAVWNTTTGELIE